MKSIALALSVVALVLAILTIWQQRQPVQTSDRVTREAPLSLWQQAVEPPAK